MLMPKQKEESGVKILAIYIILMLFISRFNVILGEYTNKLILLCGIYLWFVSNRKFTVSSEVKGYIKAYIVFLFLVIPSIAFSNNPQTGIEDYFHMWIWPYASFITIIFFISSRYYLVNMLSAFLLFSSVECLYALIQSLKYARGWGFTNSSILAIADIMCMLLPIALVVLMDNCFEKKVKKSAFFATIGILSGLLGSKSRGAWLTELFVVPIAVFRYLKSSRNYLVVFCLVLVFFLGYMLTNPVYVQRIYSITNTTTDNSNADRIWAWKSAKLMVEDYPVFGVGLGQFRDKYKYYKYEEETQDLSHTHNNFIQIAVESGVVGFIGFLYFVGYYLYTSWKNYRKQINPYDLLLFTTFLGHICIFGQIDFTLWHGAETPPVFWFLMAILMKLKETDEQFNGIRQQGD